MSEGEIGSAIVGGLLGIVFGLIVGACVSSAIWRQEAIQKGAGGYSQQTGYFEFNKRTAVESVAK